MVSTLDWGKLYYTAASGEDTHGPFGKLIALLQDLGLRSTMAVAFGFQTMGSSMSCRALRLSWNGFSPGSFVKRKLHNCQEGKAFRVWKMVAMRVSRLATTIVLESLTLAS